MSQIRSIGLALILSCGLPALPATAQTVPPADPPKPSIPAEPIMTTATYGNWVLRCAQMQPPPSADGKAARPPSQICEVVHTVQVQGRDQPLAQIAIGRLPGEKDLILTAVVPVNVSFASPVHVSGNGKTGAEEKGGLNLAWARCLPTGCLANTRLDAAGLTLLRTGTEGQLRVPDAGGQAIAVPVSWVGLDQAMAALEKAK